MRADRLLLLVLLLQAHGRLSAPVLARRLEVSVRTVLRDVEALSAAGVPVYTSRGRQGGVVLVEGYRIGAEHLTPGEATSLAAGSRNSWRTWGWGTRSTWRWRRSWAPVRRAGAGRRRARPRADPRGRPAVDAHRPTPSRLLPGGPRRRQPGPAAAPGLRGQRGPPKRQVALSTRSGSWRKPGSGTSWPSRGPAMTPVEPDGGPGGPRRSPVPGGPGPGLRGDGGATADVPRRTRRPGGGLDGAARAGRGAPVRDLPATVRGFAPAALPMVRRLLAGRVVEGGAPSPLPEGFGDAGRAAGGLRGHPARRRPRCSGPARHRGGPRVAPGDLRVALRERRPGAGGPVRRGVVHVNMGDTPEPPEPRRDPSADLRADAAAAGLPLVDISRSRDPAQREEFLARLPARRARHRLLLRGRARRPAGGHGRRAGAGPGCSSRCRSRTGSRSRTSTPCTSAATAAWAPSARRGPPTSATSWTSGPSARPSPRCRPASPTWG